MPAVVAAFGLTLFSSAFLLFWIEPLITRMLLPRLGGSQGVWNICLVFFQATLLLGYGYAHVLARFLSLRSQVLVHVVVVLAGGFFLPIAVGHWAPPPGSSPVLPLLALLMGTLGWPFFALSANTPLLQHWFSFAPHRQASNPYFLYALSNAGSLAALAGYPFLIEPAFTLSHQAALWASGYFALAFIIAAAGGLIVFTRGRAGVLPASVHMSSSIDWKTRLTWLVYAALPSSLLIGVTGYITMDIASFPLLWIVPLALYLATFIFAFAARPPLSHRAMIALLPGAIVLAGAGFWLAPVSLFGAITVELIAFFLVAMACHGELARLKPPADRLTEFYLWLSLGGVVGGALTALVSPLLFKDIIEYPLALAFVCLLRPGQLRRNTETAPIGRYVILSIAILLVLVEPIASYNTILSAFFSVCAVVAVASLARSSKLGNWLLVALAVLLGSQYTHAQVTRYGSTIWHDRSFYGAYTAMDDRRAGYRLMFHGRTAHGVERLAGVGPPQPLSYYSAAGPLGDIMRAVGPRSRAIGVIGLGIGSTGCYARPGQSWTFYEIDALVENLARHSGLFRSLSECVPDAKVVLGDGRLSLEGEGTGLYDILVLDAFSSDAIPIHLLTREAFATYVRALKPHGVLAIHISNRHFDLAPIIARIAPEAGLVAYERIFAPPAGTDLAAISPSHWMVLARDPADLDGLAASPVWTLRSAMPATKLWTDDFSNILSALR